MNIPCVLIPVIVGLICAILGYLLGKLFGNKSSDLGSLQNDLDACLEKYRNHSKTIVSLQTELALAKKSVDASSSQSFVGAQAMPAILFDAILAQKVFGIKVKENDLKIVEGIGPKIEELFHAAGIKTWQAMSETSTEKLQAVIDVAGERFSVHDAGTWAKQAEFAYQGKWQELKDWQNQLDGGKA
jgi:predicted flap endonuclease-1-like 5' DNA nuclease